MASEPQWTCWGSVGRVSLPLHPRWAPLPQGLPGSLSATAGSIAPAGTAGEQPGDTRGAGSTQAWAEDPHKEPGDSAGREGCATRQLSGSSADQQQGQGGTAGHSLPPWGDPLPPLTHEVLRFRPERHGGRGQNSGWGGGGAQNCPGQVQLCWAGLAGSKGCG